MKNIIIGTAGHIDHGKTTLIRAITGRDTDRLKEEKKRGISIDLGFTYFDLPSGKRAGIIDVPGHEKFIRNMLAGVGGMDIVMLVVAADEGVMPQTKEHLDIINLLNIKKGVIVVTKIGLVDEDWLHLIKEDIREKVKNTFLEESQMIMVDSLNGIGIEELINTIDKLAEETESRDIHSPVRMPIDRVFTITGFGTVITGTLMEGNIKVEDTLEILPDKTKVRVRNLQVHSKSVDTAYGGQRVAINVANVKKEDIERGQILAQIDSMETTLMIDGRISVLKSYPRKLENRDRIRLYHGSTEVLARVVLLDKEEILPGESGFVQLRLEETTSVKKGDKNVIRFYSPMETIGGLTVIDANPQKHKRFDEKVIGELALKETGTPEEVLEKQIERYSREFPDIGFLAKATSNQVSYIDELIEALVAKKLIIKLDSSTIIHRKFYELIKSNANTLLKQYHTNNPLRHGMLKEELKSRLFPKNKGKAVDSVIDTMEADNYIKVIEKYVALKDFQVILSDAQKKVKESIEDIYLKNQFSTPKIEELFQLLPYKRHDIEQVLEAMLGKELIRVNPEIVLHTEAINEAKKRLFTHIKEKGNISLADFRDLLDTSRKYAVALLEYFDNNKVTKRQGDQRILF
ncbi:selenocysteine-specific translation elongation factor [Alkaliphilus peptidifermentans]|uniref:Selenocysteine-specific elongation factor n=1 Tax=Alkaliphilus peptidifermentans DSM 18978 TaxID=1120976 RepID=A0A1G5J856_9FIRM|nr:selenocysteine-specific translation elongation factor [Alkaliphilus peptidifermentans]SCY83878.1 selenocysteine-specific translation elongation factor SelB [Alkaliphilus peptidifermentans DSM 18978]